ncbi:hypothetical protein HDU97_007811 [Phlyctochytrium planicorne]|nr:hypothetical protein HDU97_007811 [Phlyctochytrium planicorne]
MSFTIDSFAIESNKAVNSKAERKQQKSAAKAAMKAANTILHMGGVSTRLGPVQGVASEPPTAAVAAEAFPPIRKAQRMEADVVSRSKRPRSSRKETPVSTAATAADTVQRVTEHGAEGTGEQSKVVTFVDAPLPEVPAWRGNVPRSVFGCPLGAAHVHVVAPVSVHGPF